MPFRTATTPFTGDDDIADFMLDIWLDFATDTGPNGGMAWQDQNAAARGVHPDYEFWLSKGDLLTPAAPFVFYRTTGGSGDNSNRLFVFTGDGVNLLQEIYDQPNNPMNCPSSSPETYAGTIQQVRCQILQRMDGVFEKYWLFGDIASTYIHCVVQTRTREYRHFHVGLLKALHSDLDPSAFYVTGHSWSSLRNSDHYEFSTPAINTVEHKPYHIKHMLPFNNVSQGVTSGSHQYQNRGIMVYIPNLGVNTEDWYAMQGSDARTNGTRTPSSQATSISKPVGDVNSASSSTFFGIGQVTGYDATLGSILFSADKTFTSNFRPLLPIFITAYTDFSGDIRQAPVAQIPDVFRVNMKEIDAEEEITVGADTYVCFPMINKDSASVLAGEGYSGFEGLAYKKITGNIT